MQPDQTHLPLRDIHLPDSVSWWPIPPGYWLVLLLICVLVASIWLIKHWLRNRQLKKSIQHELSIIEAEYFQSKNAQSLIQNLSILLRRVGRAYFPTSGCESLTGTAWLSFLDNRLVGANKNKPDRIKSTDFQTGVGNVLITAPYTRQADIDADAVLNLCKRWIQQVNKNNLFRIPK